MYVRIVEYLQRYVMPSILLLTLLQKEGAVSNFLHLWAIMRRHSSDNTPLITVDKTLTDKLALVYTSHIAYGLM
jgi:hypothetical protein